MRLLFALLLAGCPHHPAPPPDDGFRRPVDPEPFPGAPADPQGLTRLTLWPEGRAAWPIWDVAEAPQGLLLAARGAGAWIVDPEHPALGRDLGVVEVQEVACSPDVAVVAEYEALHGFDPRTGRALWDATYDENPREIAFFPDNKSFVIAVSNRVERRDAATGALLWAWSASAPESDGQPDTVGAVAITPDGLTVVTHDYDRVVSLVAGTGSRTREVLRIGGNVSALALSPDGSRLLVGGWDSEVTLVEFRSGNVLDRFPTGGWVNDVVWSPDGQRFAVVDLRGELAVHAADGELLYKADVGGGGQTGLWWTKRGLGAWSDDVAWSVELP